MVSTHDTLHYCPISFLENISQDLTTILLHHSSYPMGRKQQNERKWKSAAKTCQSLDGWCTKKQPENHNRSLEEDAQENNLPQSNSNTAISDQSDAVDSTSSVGPQPKMCRTIQSDSEPFTFINDVGKILSASMNYEELIITMRALEDGQKFFLLNNHFKPPTEYIFPSQFLHNCQRQFKARYLTDYKWMVHTVSIVR